jgi:hypothetical protein
VGERPRWLRRLGPLCATAEAAIPALVAAARRRRAAASAAGLFPDSGTGSADESSWTCGGGGRDRSEESNDTKENAALIENGASNMDIFDLAGAAAAAAAVAAAAAAADGETFMDAAEESAGDSPPRPAAAQPTSKAPGEVQSSASMVAGVAGPKSGSESAGEDAATGAGGESDGSVGDGGSRAVLSTPAAEEAQAAGHDEFLDARDRHSPAGSPLRPATARRRTADAASSVLRRAGARAGEARSRGGLVGRDAAAGSHVQADGAATQSSSLATGPGDGDAGAAEAGDGADQRSAAQDGGATSQYDGFTHQRLVQGRRWTARPVWTVQRWAARSGCIGGLAHAARRLTRPSRASHACCLSPVSHARPR